MATPRYFAYTYIEGKPKVFCAKCGIWVRVPKIMTPRQALGRHLAIECKGE